MKFNYQARTKNGEIKTGIIEASSKEVAISVLQKYGLYVTLLEKSEEVLFYFKDIELFSRVSRKDIVLFSRQLSIMFDSKVSLVESLRTIAAQTGKPNFREKILKIADDVEAGASLSGAISQYPDIFSSFYIAMIKAGEASGRLAESLNYLADHLEKEYDLRGRVQGAMIYPVIVLVVAFAVLFLMAFFVIPQLSETLQESGQEMELPLITRVVLGLADFLKQWGLMIITLLVIAIVLIFIYSKTEKGKKLFDGISLKIPLVGNFLKLTYVSRFAENLSTLITSGLPISQCLEISGRVIGNSLYREIIFQAGEEVKKGRSISSALISFPEFFPPVFTQMVLVGERTGTLGKALMQVVNFYQKETERSMEGLLSALEPLLVVFLGLIVGGLMVAFLIPIYQMQMSSVSF